MNAPFQPIAAEGGVSPVGEPQSPAGSRSSYPADFRPAPGTSWIDLAASEPMVDGAINIICTRLALPFDTLPFDRKQAWLEMPDRAEWRKADTWDRIQWISNWIVGECNAAQERSIELVPCEPVSTIGD